MGNVHHHEKKHHRRSRKRGGEGAYARLMAMNSPSKPAPLSGMKRAFEEKMKADAVRNPPPPKEEEDDPFSFFRGRDISDTTNYERDNSGGKKRGKKRGGAEGEPSFLEKANTALKANQDKALGVLNDKANEMKEKAKTAQKNAIGNLTQKLNAFTGGKKRRTTKRSGTKRHKRSVSNLYKRNVSSRA